MGPQTTSTIVPLPFQPCSRESFHQIAQKKFANKPTITLPEETNNRHTLCRSSSLSVKQTVVMRYSPQTMRRNKTLPNSQSTKPSSRKAASSCLTSTDYDEIQSKSQFALTGHDEPKGLSIQERAEASWRRNLFLGKTHPPSKRLINSVYIDRWLETSGTDEPMFPSMRRYMAQPL